MPYTVSSAENCPITELEAATAALHGPHAAPADRDKAVARYNAAAKAKLLSNWTLPASPLNP
jgi:hypothetical protein